MFLDPDLAFRGLFEFPNRRNLLQLVDAPLTGFKSVSTVLRADDDQDDIFTYCDRSISMQNEDFKHIELLKRPLSDLAQFFCAMPS